MVARAYACESDDILAHVCQTDNDVVVVDVAESGVVPALPSGADLGRVALGQFVQASGVLKLEFGLSAEEILQVLEQLQPGLRLLLQTAELFHQLVTDLCISKRERPPSELIKPL
ncbi:hypothetical protein F7725_016956 [Dissostichus mawsoni]|uniref:Uncharacterized protein n=1 Tax=Dissostichus mawsoni TaxID=36200 RepID=A0A7J5Z3Z3_DISMA|nr:hypothetical protein F7725_016956 [Dissostichus mawsoni]